MAACQLSQEFYVVLVSGDMFSVVFLVACTFTGHV